MSAALARCAADPTGWTQQSATDLAAALEDGDIGRLIRIRAEAESVRVRATRLGKDMQLSAAEVCRRAERSIGLLIRRGQDAGQIRRPAERPPTRGSYDRVRDGRFEHVAADGEGRRPSGPPAAAGKASPQEWLTKQELSANGNGIYQLTDGVPDDVFERALTLARAEGRLTRANLVRRIQHLLTAGPDTRARSGARKISAPAGGRKDRP